MRNHPLAGSIPTELGPPRTERIDNWSVEQSSFFQCGRHDARIWHAFSFSETFVISKPESSIVNERATDRSTELVALANGLRRAKRIGKEVICIEGIIPEE